MIFSECDKGRSGLYRKSVNTMQFTYFNRSYEKSRVDKVPLNEDDRSSKDSQSDKNSQRVSCLS